MKYPPGDICIKYTCTSQVGGSGAVCGICLVNDILMILNPFKEIIGVTGAVEGVVVE